MVYSNTPLIKIYASEGGPRGQKDPLGEVGQKWSPNSTNHNKIQPFFDPLSKSDFRTFSSPPPSRYVHKYLPVWHGTLWTPHQALDFVETSSGMGLLWKPYQAWDFVKTPIRHWTLWKPHQAWDFVEPPPGIGLCENPIRHWTLWKPHQAWDQGP